MMLVRRRGGCACLVCGDDADFVQGGCHFLMAGSARVFANRDHLY